LTLPYGTESAWPAIRGKQKHVTHGERLAVLPLTLRK